MKLKAKTKRAIRGSISVLMVIILLPMLTFSAVIVDTSRINMAKAMVSGAGDLTMNTALANYDTILKDVYGLFAMSQGKSEEELAEDLKEYFADTISGYGVVSKAEAGQYVESLMGDFNVLLADAEGYQQEQVSNFLKLEDLVVNADRVDSSALANSSILRNQIIEYMKFRAPITFGMSFLDALKSFDVADEQMDVVEVQVKAQESTEDVTTACKKLIDLIREYDTLIKGANSGDGAVKGVANSNDGLDVPIDDYDTQIDKYLKTWGENYTHINKLMMVFLAKSPSVDDVYLVKQDVSKKVFFIKTDGTGLVYENSGIDVPVTVKKNTADAKTDVTAQLGVVNGLEGKASTYLNKSFIDGGYIKEDLSDFTDKNEDTAIKTFIEYEKFLRDKLTDVKYTEVENLLEQIYKLGKYYDNYFTLISNDIEKARINLKNAKDALEIINNTIEGIGGTLGGYVTSINDTAYAYVGDTPDITCLKKNASSYKAKAETLLSTTLPDIKGNYESYYNNNLKSGDTNKYKKMAQDVANQLNKNGSAAEKAVASATLSYLKNTGGKTYSAHIEKNVKLAQRTATLGLQDFFDTLITLSGYADGYKNSLAEYKTAQEQKETAEANVKACQTIYDDLVKQRDDTKKSYEECLKKFIPFGKAYQRDAYQYGRYVTTATNIINRETAAISTQFGNICSTIDALTKKLDAIHTQCGTVYTQIDAYLKKVDAWEAENNAYIEANGSDSFSKQVASDIATARTTYDLNSLKTLQEFVKKQYDRYNEFYTYLQGDVYFKYGGKRLHEIKNAEDAKTAAKSNIESISADIITTEIATTSLGQLYKGGTGKTFVPYTMEMKNAAGQDQSQLCFLEPVTIQIAFLKYLNSSYPANAPTYAEGEKNPKTEYENTEKELKTPSESIDDMGEEKTEETTKDDDKKGDDKKGDDKKGDDKKDTVKTDKYGYSYKNVKLSDTDKSARPSKDKVKSSSANNGAFKLDENGKATGTAEKPGSVEKQGNVLDTILDGLGSAIEAGVENAYILTYIFENFSYNTMVQDAVIDSAKDRLGDSGLSNLATAKGLLQGDTLAKYKDSMKTLSGFQKKAANNYLYGAEIEYILFGNTDPAKNVSSMKASIYGIRFAFNCIYAFTNTEIRNTTRAAGLAVQAATMGVVPYQVVQIVLQLAMAAAESAFDLSLMMSGLDVAVVKTKDTWMLSVSSAVKATGEYVAQKGSELAGQAINKVTGGLQQVLDVSADKLNGAIENVKNDVSESANQAVRDTIDSAFGVVTNKIESVLNELQYAEVETQEAAKKWVSDNLANAKKEIEKELDSRFGNSDIGKKVVEKIKTGNNGSSYIDALISIVQTKVDTAIESAPLPSQAVEMVMDQLTDIKMEMVNTVTSLVNQLIGSVSDIAKDTVDQIHTKLDGYIEQAGKDLSEEASKAIREGVTNVTNDFMENTLSKIDTTVDGGSGGSSVASMFKFGYKEYLMLFVYIGICAGGQEENNKILLRTADVIQFNITHAGSGAEFKHAKGDAFRMKNACTYISVTAEANLDMFFMDMDIFASVVEDEPLEGETGTTVEQNGTKTKIKYKGLMGY